MKAVWEGEQFEELLNCPLWVVCNQGPLRGPILKFSIRRNDDFQIELLTISETSLHSAPARRANPSTTGSRAGTVGPATDVVELDGPAGTVKLGGVVLLGVKSTSDFARQIECHEQRSLVHSIVRSPKATDTVGYQFEWINNLELDEVLPHSFRVESDDTSILSFPGSGMPIEIRSGRNGGNHGNCYRLTIDDHEIVIGQVPGSENRTKRNEAYVLYRGQASEGFRRKFRECLSFAFGRPLIYLGYDLLTPDSVSCGFEAVAGFNADHARYAYVGLPPAPLFEGHYIMVSERVTTRLLKGLFAHYDALNFLHVSWLYWHGLCSALHSQAVQVGAAIEALQVAQAAANPDAFNTKLMDKPQYRALREGVEKLVSEMNFDDGVKGELQKKIDQLNKPSQRVINERFFEALNLKMGPEESQAWRRRNDAAHGTGTEDYHGLVRDIKLLKNIFARIVLRVSGGSEYYIDYYTPGFPARKLDEPVSSTNPPLCLTRPD
ncbi:MAG: hypothetical protein JWQ90_3228 [Hydrocarboniphaga sp.]|uniref:hypothetical protein n=1 Tax=Hydrocarboniphaga sp. TaxID=2033016 RepID=UPI002611C64A|nr:hypothetical protein [Hydrocarboniphaga sp.]MDB5970778.1 hypothetical protein [Hydrocarboniphaga sp.]